MPWIGQREIKNGAIIARHLAALAIGTAAINALAVTTAKIAAAAVTSAKLDPTTIQYAEVALTSAQVKDLRATPITLVAAPGAGKVLEFVSATLLLDYGSNGWTEAGDTGNLGVKYDSGAGALVSETIEGTGFIDQTADTSTRAIPKKDAIVAKTGCENKALVLHNVTGAEIAGNAANDNALRVKIAYRVHTTGW